MDDDAATWSAFTEAEWLDTWAKALAVLERTRDALDDELTDVQAARLDGEAAMLRRVLASRGVKVD